MPRGRNLVFPLILIGIGVLVLLANLGVLSSGALQRLGDLWPLLLIIIGLQLILNHTLPRAQATLVGLAATVVIVAGAVVYAALAPSTALGTQHADSSQGLNGLSSATLVMDYGASTIDIGSAADDHLYQAHFDYPAGESPPTVSLDQPSGTITISQNGGFSGFHFFGSGDRHATINLSTKIPWTIRMSGGASTLNMDVRELQLANLDITGGASTVDAHLGAPKGTVALHFTGGASSLTVHLPSGSQWSVSVSGGVSSLTVDGQSSGAFGDISKQSSGYSGASDRFDIRVTGGVSHLTLLTS